eukprot:12901329-Alexandrium_andersonii.AAC.1
MYHVHYYISGSLKPCLPRRLTTAALAPSASRPQPRLRRRGSYSGEPPRRPGGRPQGQPGALRHFGADCAG